MGEPHLIGKRIGNYRVTRKIGHGGMGDVYEGVHVQIRQRVAIKVLRAEFSKKPEVATRFLNEALAVNIVGHPGLVRIHDYGLLPGGVAYIVMELLEGESLGDRLRRQTKLPACESLRIGRQIASALGATHDTGIIHRDLKPDNVMLVCDPETTGGERVKILDFGLAKVAAEFRDVVLNEADTYLKTRSHLIMGTPVYMAPEQCRGAAGVTDRADVYSLGIMLYHLLAGRPPFRGPFVQVMAMHLAEPPPKLLDEAPGVAADLATLVHTMLAKEPLLRPSMQQVAEEMERLGAPKATGWMPAVFAPPASLVSVSSSLLGLAAAPRASFSLADATGQTGKKPRQRRQQFLLVLAGAALSGLLFAATWRVTRPRVHHQPPKPPAAVAAAMSGGHGKADPPKSMDEAGKAHAQPEEPKNLPARPEEPKNDDPIVNPPHNPPPVVSPFRHKIRKPPSIERQTGTSA